MEENLKSDEPRKLFDEFSVPSYEEWRAEVDRLLKGAPYDKIMLTKTYEHITLNPMYRRQDIEGMEHLKSLPGTFPFVRGNDAAGYFGNMWDISQEIPLITAREFNEALLSELNRGQTAVNIKLDKLSRIGLNPSEDNKELIGEDGTSISSLKDLETALNGIFVEHIALNFNAQLSGFAIFAMLKAYFKKHSYDISRLNGSLGMDPLGYLAENGSLPEDIDTYYKQIAEMIKWAKDNCPDFRILKINTHCYHNAGSGAVEETAAGFNTALEYMRELSKYGVEIADIAKSLHFSVSIGRMFFIEIAKLRAGRMVWANIMKEMTDDEEAQKMRVYARTSEWNKTKFDPYVNMLRTTTEAFSAVIGGVENLHVGPFDEGIRISDEFSRRISRNTQIILQEECHFDQLIDPAGGSYYIEWLTEALAGKIWDQFALTEDNGGLIAELKDGKIFERINLVWEQRLQNMNKRKDVFIGTNMYPNLTEEALDTEKAEAEKAKEQVLKEFKLSNKTHKIETSEKTEEAFENGLTIGEIEKNKTEDLTVTPMPFRRAMDHFEKLRQAVEKSERKPTVYLANTGRVNQYKARADFSQGFFQVAAFDVIYGKSFQTPEESAEAALESKADIVVICNIDPNYPEIVPPFAKKIKEENPEIILVLAGYPKAQIEDHKKSGVDEFIHVRANNYQMLKTWAEKLGAVL
ncbi:MAG: methylmalonyl-CoA mutase [Candidatus Cloacimonadota bacterium]|nr:MAG: methylmalonyl-CoA mutase [Candidatus Cloacimonadota bacterium]